MDLSVGPTTAAAPAGPRQFATSLRKLASRQGVDETLQLVVDLSIELMAGCDLADVMLVHPSGATTPVATDPLAVALDRAQVESGEGRVCMSRSTLSYRRYLCEVRSDRIGALNLCGHPPAASDDGAVPSGRSWPPTSMAPQRSTCCEHLAAAQHQAQRGRRAVERTAPPALSPFGTGWSPGTSRSSWWRAWSVDARSGAFVLVEALVCGLEGRVDAAGDRGDAGGKIHGQRSALLPGGLQPLE